MMFKEGDAVEVLSTGKEQYDFWFPAKVTSADRYKYTVRYEFFHGRTEGPVVEDVCKENVRPQPPLVKGKRWVLDDIVEVFDHHSWRVGKVVKVLNYDWFVIKLFGSIQLKEFHRSNLRVRQAWKNNKWFVSKKVDGNKQITIGGNTKNISQGRGSAALEQRSQKEAGTLKNERQEHFEVLPPVRTFKRKHECNFVISPIDLAMARDVKAQKTMLAGRCGMLPARTPAVLKQVAVGSSSEKKMSKNSMIRSKTDDATKKTDNNSLHPFPMPALVTKESSECSVASCSANDLPEYTIQHSQRSPRDAGSSFNDTRSLCATESGRKHLPSYPEVELEADIHKLELHAYKLTMQAFYASGPLSWEQESLLTNLRLSLHISNEEHLLHLKHLLSSQVR